MSWLALEPLIQVLELVGDRGIFSGDRVIPVNIRIIAATGDSTDGSSGSIHGRGCGGMMKSLWSTTSPSPTAKNEITL